MEKNFLMGKDLKSQFPIFINNEKVLNGHIRPLVYLDSAVSAHKPQCVIDAMRRNMEAEYGSVHRGAYGLSIQSSEMYENTRKKVAQFIGKTVSSSQVIFTKGTTESLNILAHGFLGDLLTENDRIVLPMAEHHANFIPWQQTALAKNCEIAYLSFSGKSGKDLKLNLDEAKKLIDKKTKIVTLATMGNVLGQINPVAEIIAMAKEVGAYVFLDCAQSVTCLEDDYFAMGADAVSFSSHKLYGPTGLGILAMSKDLMEKLPPLLYGGGMISNVTLEESTWATGPAKFEAGTPPISEVAGLGAAIDWVNGVGRKNIHKHASELNSCFLERLHSLPDIEIFSPQTGDETLLSFRHKKFHAHDMVTVLDSFNVCMRAGHHCAWPLIRFLGVDALVRCSFAAYSDLEDVEAALEAIKSISKFI